MEIWRPRLRTHNNLALHLRRGSQRAAAGHRRARLRWRGWRRAPARPLAALAVCPERRLPWLPWPPCRLGQRPVVGLWRGLRRLPAGRPIASLAAHSPRVQSTCPAPARVANSFLSALGDRLASLGPHSPQVQSNRPPAARVATSPRFGRPIGFLGTHSPQVQSNRLPAARVATSPRFGRLIGFLGTPIATSAIEPSACGGRGCDAISRFGRTDWLSLGLTRHKCSRTRPPAARVATSPRFAGDRLASLGLTRHKCSSNRLPAVWVADVSRPLWATDWLPWDSLATGAPPTCPAPARVATSPRFARF